MIPHEAQNVEPQICDRPRLIAAARLLISWLLEADPVRDSLKNDGFTVQPGPVNGAEVARLIAPQTPHSGPKTNESEEAPNGSLST